MVHLRKRLSRVCLCCLVAMSFCVLPSQNQTFALLVKLKAVLLDVSPGGPASLGSNISTPCGAFSLLIILSSLIPVSLLGLREHGWEQATEMVKACS